MTVLRSLLSGAAKSSSSGRPKAWWLTLLTISPIGVLLTMHSRRITSGCSRMLSEIVEPVSTGNSVTSLSYSWVSDSVQSIGHSLMSTSCQGYASDAFVTLLPQVGDHAGGIADGL